MADAFGPIVIVIVAAALLIVFWRAGKRADRRVAPVKAAAVGDPQDNLDLWRAMDKGEDPTE